MMSSDRINQRDILPLAVKQRHIDGYIIFHGLLANRPADGSTEIKVYFATDNNNLYIWNGAAWKSVLLT